MTSTYFKKKIFEAYSRGAPTSLIHNVILSLYIALKTADEEEVVVDIFQIFTLYLP